MIALWMIYAVAITCALGLAAAALDSTAEWRGWPRRWIWAGALAAAIAIPAWTAWSPAGSGPTPQVDPARTTPEVVAGSGASSPVTQRIADLLAQARPDAAELAALDSPVVAGWALLSATALALYLAAGATLAGRRRRWRRLRIDAEQVLVADDTGPAVVGALRPAIVVPEWSLALPAGERELMLAHEREHVRARDPLLLHAAAVIVLLVPWNVAAWWLLRRLRLAVEMDCDARVLGAGRDARAYGTLLLEVCRRRARGASLVAPALLERTSSLARRILAMQPRRPRFPRVHAAFTGGLALSLIVLACEAPSPEIFAPDGTDSEAKLVYGKVAAAEDAVTARQLLRLDRRLLGELGRDRQVELRAIVEERFPDVARGATGPAMLFVVENDRGEIVISERQVAKVALRALKRESGANELQSVTLRADTIELIEEAKTRAGSFAYKRPLRSSGITPNAGSAVVAGVEVPVRVAALRPEEIAAVEVSKHAAGRLAPDAVSVILIQLKPGARVP